MPPRVKSWAVLAFVLLALYLVFWRDDTPFNSRQHAVDVLQGNIGEVKGAEELSTGDTPNQDDIHLQPTTTKLPQLAPTPIQAKPSSATSIATEPSTKAFAEVSLTSSSRRIQGKPSTTASTAQGTSTKAAGTKVDEGPSRLQEQFEKENDALGQ